MNFRIDPQKTRLHFAVKHMMIHTVKGAFTDVEAEIILDPNDLAAASATARIATRSVNTKDRLRDEYLTSGSFFQPEKFPHLVYRSTSVRPRGKKLSVTGMLTIRDKERQLILDGTWSDLGAPGGGSLGGSSPGGKRRLRFDLTGELDREAYDLTFHGAVETVSIVVGKKVKLDLSIEVVES